MALKPRPASKLLLVKTTAHGVDDQALEILRDRLSDFSILDLDRHRDFVSLATPRATILVAGGDGAVSIVARELAGDHRRLGILPLGTFNNFARALGIPEALEDAIQVIRGGRTRPVTIGRINGQPFLEAAAVGMFGEAIVLGE